AFAAAILDHGYDPDRASFSRYRTFTIDLVVKRKGQTYETDVEFCGPGGKGIDLQIEAKATPRATTALAAAIECHRELRDLPARIAEEIEYVLDLTPLHLWVVGPG